MKHSQPRFLSNCSLPFCGRSFLVTGTTMLGRVHTRIFRSMTNSTAKTAHNLRKIEPDFVKTPVLISLETAQNSSHLIFSKISTWFLEIKWLESCATQPEIRTGISENQVRLPLNFWPFFAVLFLHILQHCDGTCGECAIYLLCFICRGPECRSIYCSKANLSLSLYLLTGLGDAYGGIGIQFHSGWRVAAVYLNNHERFPGLKQLSLTELTDLWWSVLLLGARGLVKCFLSLLLAVPQSAHVDPKDYQLTATGIHRLFTSKHCLQFTSKHCSRKTVAEPAGRTHDQLYQLRHNLIVEQSSFYFFPAQLANSSNISAKWHAVLLWQV